jgi:hypothetical protein
MAARAVLEEKIVTVTFDRHLPLDERILRIDHIQARRYSKLGGVALEIATQGILRHLRACDRMDVNPDTSAVREIIDDALNGRRVFAEGAEQIQAAESGFLLKLKEVAPKGRSLYFCAMRLAS